MEADVGIFLVYPPTQKVTVCETVDECVEGTLRSMWRRHGLQPVGAPLQI
jgi:hypothetical protein